MLLYSNLIENCCVREKSLITTNFLISCYFSLSPSLHQVTWPSLCHSLSPSETRRAEPLCLIKLASSLQCVCTCLPLYCTRFMARCLNRAGQSVTVQTHDCSTSGFLGLICPAGSWTLLQFRLLFVCFYKGVGCSFLLPGVL